MVTPTELEWSITLVGFVLGDEIIALISQSVLRENPGGKIIGDVKCSDRMYSFIRDHGGDAIMWKTGHSLIKEKVKVEKAPFGGELSGHVFFADHATTDTMTLFTLDSESLRFSLKSRKNNSGVAQRACLLRFCTIGNSNRHN